MVEHNARLDRRTVLTGLGAGMASLAGCSTIASDSSDNEIRIGSIHPPMELDPIDATDVGSLQTIARIFDGLYTYDDGTDIVPQIATGGPSVADDGRRTTFGNVVDRRDLLHCVSVQSAPLVAPAPLSPA